MKSILKEFHWSTQVFLNHLHVVLPRGISPGWIPLLNVKTWSRWDRTCYAHTIRSQTAPMLNAWGCQLFSKYLYNSIFRVIYARDISVRAEIQYNDDIVTVTTVPNKIIHIFEEYISRIATHIWCVWSCDPVCTSRRYTKRGDAIFHALPLIESEILSAIITTGAALWPETCWGKIEESTTRRPRTPCTLRSGSTTELAGSLPIRQVPT